MDPITLILTVAGLIVAILFGVWQVYIGHKQLRSNWKPGEPTSPPSNGKKEIVAKTIIPVEDLHEIEQEYRESLIREYKDHVIRGFSPRIGGRDVSLPLAKIFLPLEAIEGRPALSQYAEEDIYRQMAGSAMGELDWQRRSLEVEKRSAQLNVLQAAQKPLSLAQLLDNSRAILLGDPGTGKTTITHYITYALASNDSTHVGQSVCGLTPVLVRLANFGKAFENDRTLHLVEYIEKELASKPEFGRYLRKAIELGQCLIILDGLDEIGDPSLRIRVTERIQTTVAGYNRNRFFVTSRIVGYDRSPLTREFKHATLKKMEPADQARFVRLWYDALSVETGSTYKDGADNLITALKNKPQISRLAANPLLLTIMVLMHWRGVKLPSRRVEIYENATDTLIEYWTMHRERVDLDGHEIKAILEPIAHYILSSNVSGVIAHHDLLPRFHKGIAERRGIDIAHAEKVGRDLLRALGEESGIFLERGLDANGQPVYGFLHQTFGEYLAALKMAEEVLSNKFDIGHYIHRSIWREPLLLLVGHLSLISQSHLVYLIRQILDFKGPFEEQLKQNVLLAADCLADDIQIRPDLRDEILSKLVELLWHEAPQAREKAVDNYHRLAMTRHREIATKILKDKLEQYQNIDDLSPEIRFSLAQALVHLDQQDRAKLLLWPLESERYKREIRQDKVQRLHFEGWPKQAVDYVLQLQADVNQGLYIKPEIDLSKFVFGPVDAATALRVIGEQDLLKLIDILLNKIKDEEDRASLKLLYALIPKVPESEKLIYLLTSDTPAEVRCLSAIKLLETEYRGKSIEILQNLVATEPKQAPRAAQALLRINEKDNLNWQLLRDTAFIGDDESVTNAIVVLLEAGEVTTAIPAAINLLCLYPPKVQLEEEIRLWPVVEALIKYDHNAIGLEAARWLSLRPGYYYRLHACEALLDAGQIESAIPLLQYLAFECHDKFSRGACQRLLMLKEVERLVPMLANAVNSDDAEMCYHACKALFLANCGPESCAAIARSRTELKVSILNERTLTLQNTLDKFCKTSLDTLEAIETTNEQEKAFKSLAQLVLRMCFDLPETTDQNDAAEKLLTCSQPIVKINAILFDLSAGNIDRVKENLIELLNETQNRLSLPVYFKAVKTLGQIACSETTTLLLKILENADKLLRKCVIEVLGPLGDQSVTPHLIKRLDDKDKDIRQAAAKALGELGDPFAIESLIRTLKDEDHSVRENAADALWLLKDPIAVQPLINTLKDNNNQVRSEAAAALGDMSDFKSTQFLIDALKDDASIVRSGAAYALGRLKNPIAVQPLIEALDDHDNDTYFQIARSLGWLGDPLAIQPLIDSLNYKGERSFRGTAYAFESLQNNFLVTEILLNALNNEDKKMRAAAAAMLGYIGNPIGTPFLIAAQGNANKLIREIATLALCFLENPNLSENLVVSMYDEFLPIRAFASLGLAKTRTVSYSLHLNEAMRDEYEWIRSNAIEALGLIGNGVKSEHIVLVAHDNIWLRSSFAETIAKHKNVKYLPMLKAISVVDHVYYAAQHTRALIHLDPTSALTVLERYTQQFRRYGSIRNLMGQAKWSIGEPEFAHRCFHEAIELEATSEYILSLTRFYLEQDNLQLASQYLDEAYEKARNYFERESCLLHQAVLHWSKGDNDNGLASLKLVKARRRKSFIEDLEYNDFWREKGINTLKGMLGQLETQRGSPFNMPNFSLTC